MGKEGTAGLGAREKLRELADRLVMWRGEVVEVKAGLLPNSRLRSGLECILTDRIDLGVDELIALSREGDLGANGGASGD